MASLDPFSDKGLQRTQALGQAHSGQYLCELPTVFAAQYAVCESNPGVVLSQGPHGGDGHRDLDGAAQHATRSIVAKNRQRPRAPRAVRVTVRGGLEGSHVLS